MDNLTDTLSGGEPTIKRELWQSPGVLLTADTRNPLTPPEPAQVMQMTDSSSDETVSEQGPTRSPSIPLIAAAGDFLTPSDPFQDAEMLDPAFEESIPNREQSLSPTIPPMNAREDSPEYAHSAENTDVSGPTSDAYTGDPESSICSALPRQNGVQTGTDNSSAGFDNLIPGASFSDESVLERDPEARLPRQQSPESHEELESQHQERYLSKLLRTVFETAGDGDLSESDSTGFESDFIPDETPPTQLDFSDDDQTSRKRRKTSTPGKKAEKTTEEAAQRTPKRRTRKRDKSTSVAGAVKKTKKASGQRKSKKSKATDKELNFVDEFMGYDPVAAWNAEPASDEAPEIEGKTKDGQFDELIAGCPEGSDKKQIKTDIAALKKATLQFGPRRVLARGGLWHLHRTMRTREFPLQSKSKLNQSLTILHSSPPPSAARCRLDVYEREMCWRRT